MLARRHEKPTKTERLLRSPVIEKWLAYSSGKGGQTVVVVQECAGVPWGGCGGRRIEDREGAQVFILKPGSSQVGPAAICVAKGLVDEHQPD